MVTAIARIIAVSHQNHETPTDDPEMIGQIFGNARYPLRSGEKGGFYEGEFTGPVR